MTDHKSQRHNTEMKRCWTCLVGLLTLMSFGDVLRIRAENRVLKKTSSEESLDARRAKSYLDKICRIGPRVSGSRGMAQQQNMIVKHFTRFGARVRYQSFDVAHPVTGRPVRMNNLIVSWNPQSKQRVLFACHYDTLPYPDPDRDPRNPRGIFLGANDGASGVALFMELAHHMQTVKSTHGVDFVFFDGEELIYWQQQGNQIVRRGEFFLGSKHFAKEYRDRPPDHQYVYGILVDMIADRDLNIYQEKNSLKYAPKLTQSIWAVAKRLKVREFYARQKHEILDDHLPLNVIAKIPTCDIIDFDYPAWHTTRDVPRRCSGASMVKVGRVLLAWLKELPPLEGSGAKQETEKKIEKTGASEECQIPGILKIPGIFLPVVLEHAEWNEKRS